MMRNASKSNDKLDSDINCMLYLFIVISGDNAPKKQKTENFRQKEKRKRDEGQSSRGKSYVEEEKRILRQDFIDD